MTEVIDIDGLEAVGGLARTGAGELGDTERGAVGRLQAVDRWSDAGMVSAHLGRVTTTLEDVAVDLEARAGGMSEAEAAFAAQLIASFGGKADAPDLKHGITFEQQAAWNQLQQLLQRRDVYRAIGGEAGDVLVADMDGRIADLIAGFDRRDWAAIAHLDAGLDPDAWRPGAGLPANDATVRGVYDFYGEVFLANPEVQWAGLANLVGPAFYGGWQDMHALSRVFDDSDRAQLLSEMLPLPDLPEVVWDALDTTDLMPMSPLDLGQFVTTDALDWLLVQMLDMQRQIFRDLGWQLSAYHYGGLAAVVAAAPPPGPDGEWVATPWVDIASGDPDRVAAGNLALLDREQRIVIQDDYEQMRNHSGPVGSLATQVMTLLADHGVPGGRPYREVVVRIVDVPVLLPDTPALWPPGEWIPIQVEEVTVRVPRGNIADFDDRWEWITEDLLPAYQALLDEPAELRALISTPIDVRAREARLLPGLSYPGPS